MSDAASATTASAARRVVDRAVYCAAPGLSLKHWGEEVAVAYDTATAKTHLLSAEALWVLQSASQAGVTSAELLAALPPQADGALNASETALAALLDGLCSAQLLQRTECQPS